MNKKRKKCKNLHLSCRRLDSVVLPLFLVDADGQAAPLRVQVLGELPPVADVSGGIEFGDDLDPADPAVLDLGSML
jgi:hypothetical protein